MESQETVDYRLLRQKQQEERFRARGATWKPSGKACTLQFVFDDEPKRPVEAKGINQPNTTHLKSSKMGKQVATSVSREPVLAGHASQSKGRIGRTKNIKPVNTDVLDAGFPLQSDEERLELPAPSRPARPRKPLKPKAVAELPQGHVPTKKSKVKDSRSAKQSSIVGKNPIVYESDAIPSPLPDSTGPQASISKPAQRRKKKEVVKASLDPPLSNLESSEPDKEVNTVARPIPRSVKPRRPKKVERTVETRDWYEDTEKESVRPKKGAKAVVHDEDIEQDMELAQDTRASKVEFVAAIVPGPSDGRNAQSSKKRRILVDDGAQQWSMPTAPSTFRKTTIHFGLPLGGAR